MGASDDVRRAFQDMLAPELQGINQRLDAIDKRIETMRGSFHATRDELREEMRALESRIHMAIEQAKREVVLTVKLADAEQRYALLTKQLGEAKK